MELIEMSIAKLAGTASLAPMRWLLSVVTELGVQSSWLMTYN